MPLITGDIFDPPPLWYGALIGGLDPLMCTSVLIGEDTGVLIGKGTLAFAGVDTFILEGIDICVFTVGWVVR